MIDLAPDDDGSGIVQKIVAGVFTLAVFGLAVFCNMLYGIGMTTFRVRLTCTALLSRTKSITNVDSAVFCVPLPNVRGVHSKSKIRSPTS